MTAAPPTAGISDSSHSGAMLALDLSCTPFSRRGSYLAVSAPAEAVRPGVHLRSVRGIAKRRELFQLLVGGTHEVSARTWPGMLELSAGDSLVQVALAGSGRALVRLVRGTLTLEPQVRSAYDVVLADGPGTWRFVASGAGRNYRIAVEGGTAVLDRGWDGVKAEDASLVLTAADGPVLVRVEEFGSSPPTTATDDFDDVVREAETAFEQWWARHGADEVAEDLAPTARLAAYVLWGALVPAEGLLRRESMLMSKNTMTHVWSWDHCFNAMALRRDPAAAADQLLTIFDHQDAFGALPDYVDDVELEPNFVKPPVHGWAIAYLMDRGGLSDDAVATLYEPLVRWTRWWFEHRDYRGDGVPSYNHGNDSGWDNATVFADGVPVQSPDLLAFLALQMSALARMADLLGRADDADGWRARAAATTERMVEHFWVDGRFVARGTHDQHVVEADSLLTLMPLALGEALPEPQRTATLQRLREGGYLTAHGLASEPPSSDRYESDGYWRGPIWAPSTMLLVDGLRRAGEEVLAAQVAERFVALCAASGMAENFDAVTGAGLRDRSMTWTAAVLLELLPGAAGTVSGLSVRT